MFNLESYLHQWPLAGLDAEALSNTVTFCPTGRKGGGVAQLVECRTADAGAMPQCGKGFFSQSQLSMQTPLRCPYTPLWNHMH